MHLILIFVVGPSRTSRRVFCSAFLLGVYVHFSPRLSRRLTGWVGGFGLGGGLDSVLSPASYGIFVSTRS